MSGPSDELSDPPGLHDLQLNARAAAVFLWLVAWAGAIADAFYPKIPDPLVNGFFAAALAATLIAVALRLAVALRAWILAAVEAALADPAEDSAEEVSEGLVAQAYQMGKRVGERRAGG